MAEGKRDLDEMAGIVQRLADQGTLLEHGFRLFARGTWLPGERVPADDWDNAQLAYMTGAYHTFSTVMFLIRKAGNASDEDLQRLINIQKELESWLDRITERLNVVGERP